MKKIGILMSVYMGLIMSFCLSLAGTLMGGHFTIPGWLVSFAISLVISLIIGFLVPIKKVSDAICRKFKVEPESMDGNRISSLVSDIIYTPVITVVMVVIMVGNARKHIPEEILASGQGPSLGKELLIALPMCFVIGYVIIMIVQPILVKALIKKYAKGGQGMPPKAE